jgi:DNA-binding transcriptional ArsR family regulator
MESQLTSRQVKIAEELVEVFDSKFFKTLSEPVRVQILKFIMLNGRVDIGTIAENMPQDRSVISRHLNLMHEVGILQCEKESRHMFYEINAQAFLDKLVNITEKIRTCMAECCPSCML